MITLKSVVKKHGLPKVVFGFVRHPLLNAVATVDGVLHGYHEDEPGWSCPLCQHSQKLRTINQLRRATS